MFQSMIFGTSQGEICDPSLGMAVCILGPRSTPRGRWKALDGVRRSWVYGAQNGFFSGWKVWGAVFSAPSPVAPSQAPLCTSLVVSNIFYVHPLFGEDSHFDEHIFQMGLVATTNYSHVMALQAQQPPAVSRYRRLGIRFGATHGEVSRIAMRFMAIFVDRNLWQRSSGKSVKQQLHG